MNILVTGKDNKLFQNLSKSGMFENDNLYEYEYETHYTNIDQIYHFGTPLNVEEFEVMTDRATSSIVMIDHTVDIVGIAVANKSDVIYCSSQGVYEINKIDTILGLNIDQRYNIFKLSNEEYLKSFNDLFNTCILRVPRDCYTDIVSNYTEQSILEFNETKKSTTFDYSNLHKEPVFIGDKDFIKKILDPEEGKL